MATGKTYTASPAIDFIVALSLILSSFKTPVGKKVNETSDSICDSSKHWAESTIRGCYDNCGYFELRDVTRPVSVQTEPTGEPNCSSIPTDNGASVDNLERDNCFQSQANGDEIALKADVETVLDRVNDDIECALRKHPSVGRTAQGLLNERMQSHRNRGLKDDEIRSKKSGRDIRRAHDRRPCGHSRACRIRKFRATAHRVRISHVIESIPASPFEDHEGGVGRQSIADLIRALQRDMDTKFQILEARLIERKDILQSQMPALAHRIERTALRSEDDSD